MHVPPQNRLLVEEVGADQVGGGGGGGPYVLR